MNPTEKCSHCGEIRTEGQPHDSQHCWTIAHAYVTTNQGWDVAQNDATEADQHIVELSRWLRDHQPRPSWTHQQRRARKDRERSLEMWIAKAQMIDTANQK